jgi:hypothetical protein
MIQSELLNQVEVTIQQLLTRLCILISTSQPRVLHSMSLLPLEDMQARHRQVATLQS